MLLKNLFWVRFVAAALALLIPSVPGPAWALRQVAPAQQRGGLEEITHALRERTPQPDLPSVVNVFYRYSDLFQKFFNSGHVGRYALAGWNEFLQEVRNRSPEDYSLLLHLKNIEGYLLHGDLLLYKPTQQAILLTGNPGTGKSLLAAVAAADSRANWLRENSDSLWEYLANDQVLVLKSGSTLLAGLPPVDKPGALITKFPLPGAMPGQHAPGSVPVTPFWRVGIYERQRFAPLSGITWVNRDRAKKGSQNWRDILGTETFTRAWTGTFSRRLHQLPVLEVYVAGPTTPEKFEKKVPGMARWAKRIAGDSARTGLEEVVLLEPGQPGYAEAVGRAAELGVEGVLKGPMGDYLKGLKEGSVIRLRVVAGTPEEEKDWKEFGLKPLVDPAQTWVKILNQLAWPKDGLEVVQEKTGDQVVREFVELKFKPGTELPSSDLSDPVRLERLRLFPSQTVTFDSSKVGFNLKNPKMFVIQVTTRLSQRLVELAGVPLGLPGAAEKEEFVGLAGLLREDLPESAWRQRALSEPEVSAHRQAMELRARADRESAVAREIQAEVESLRADLLVRIRALREGPDGSYLNAERLGSVEVEAGQVSAEGLVKGSIVKQESNVADLAVFYRGRLEDQRKQWEQRLAEVDQVSLEGPELKTAVERLRTEFSELRVPPDKEGPPQDVVEVLVKGFSSKEARQERWGPVQTARLLRQIRATGERLRTHLDGRWFDEIEVDLSRSHPFPAGTLVVSAAGRFVLVLRVYPLQYGQPEPSMDLNTNLLFNFLASQLLGLSAGQSSGAVSDRVSLSPEEVNRQLLENQIHPAWAELPAFPKVPLDDQLLSFFIQNEHHFIPGTHWDLSDFVADRLAVSLQDAQVTEGMERMYDAVLARLERGIADQPFFPSLLREMEQAAIKALLQELPRMEATARSGRLSDQFLEEYMERNSNPNAQKTREIARDLVEMHLKDQTALATLAIFEALFTLAPQMGSDGRLKRVSVLWRRITKELSVMSDIDIAAAILKPLHSRKVDWVSTYQILVEAYTEYGRGIHLKNVGEQRTGLEEVRVLSVEELLERVQGALLVGPAGRSHAVLIPKDGSAIPPQQGEVALYAHESVMGSVRQFLVEQRLRIGPVVQHVIQIDNLSQANLMVQQATDSMRSGQAVVIALRSGRTEGIQLPQGHAPVLLVDPATWLGVDQRALAAYLARQDQLLGLLLDLSSGSISAVRLDDGREYYLLFASA